MTIFIASVAIALFVSFFCSLVEATLLSLTPSQIAEIAVGRPKLGIVWQRFKANIERPIAVVLLLNTTAHTVGAAVAGAQFDKIFGDEWIWLFSLMFTFVMLQFTEILPKTLGVRFNRRIAGMIAIPLNVSLRIFGPILRALHWINRPFEPKSGDDHSPSTVEELSMLAGLAQLSDQISTHQAKIIRTTARLTTLKAHQVMIPFDHVSFLSTSQSLIDAVAAAHIDSHTRFPVCEGDDPNRIVGYVNFKEMIYFMKTNPNLPNLKGVIRPIRSFAPTESVPRLLKKFMDEHIHIAIVKDGDRTLGLITMEDLIEEIVGDIEDEFDRMPKMFHPLGDGNTWMVGGGVTMTDLYQRVGLSGIASPETVSSWAAKLFNRLPKAGDVFQVAGYECTVRRVRRGKVFELAIARKNTAETG